MTKQRIVVMLIVSLSMTRLSGQIEQGRPSRRATLKEAVADTEKSKVRPEWFEQRQKQRQELARERMDLMDREAWKRLLAVGEPQWRRIEPIIDKVQVLGWRTMRVRALGSADSVGGYRWKRPSRDGGPMSGKTADQMPEGYRIIEELVDLLEDENSKDEQIRQKMDALQKVREDARKELAAVGKELAALPLTPRQEAIFLIMGYID